jgi:hypothetical protein
MIIATNQAPFPIVETFLMSRANETTLNIAARGKLKLKARRGFVPALSRFSADNKTSKNAVFRPLFDLAIN